MAFDDQSLVVGSTYRHKITATKDTAVWDLTSATVKLYLKKPGQSSATEYSATVSDPTAGVAIYDVATTVYDTAGLWSRSWKVTDGAVVQETPPFNYMVIDSP